MSAWYRGQNDSVNCSVTVLRRCTFAATQKKAPTACAIGAVLRQTRRERRVVDREPQRYLRRSVSASRCVPLWFGVSVCGF